LELQSPSPSAFEFAAQVVQAYSALIESADREAGLGGRLLYAGELDDMGRACVVAANIAGAATLAATADRAAQKQAIRDGVTDFLVNSLDEALRILKNQLRKRETASVCVALSPTAVEGEMKDRGIEPDLLRREVRFTPCHEALMLQEEPQEEGDLKKIPALVTWRVDSELPRDLSRLDEIAVNCLGADEWQARRWMRLAPRYFGRLAQGQRLIASHREFAARFAEQVKSRVENGEIAVAVGIESYFRGLRDEFRFEPSRR
jgi:urocanate hydratase